MGLTPFSDTQVTHKSQIVDDNDVSREYSHWCSHQPLHIPLKIDKVDNPWNPTFFSCSLEGFCCRQICQANAVSSPGAFGLSGPRLCACRTPWGNCGWKKSCTTERMVEKCWKDHQRTGEGFRNHPQYFQLKIDDLDLLKQPSGWGAIVTDQNV